MTASPRIAEHLAYYAELRATLAILAAEGIGIFDDVHFLVSSLGDTYQLSMPQGGRTHVAAWKALKHWSESPSAVDIVSRVLRVGGFGYDDWLQASGIYVAPTIQCAKWFRDWGLDLSHLSAEQQVRNSASYDPSTGLAPPLAITEVVLFVRAVWDALAPDTATGFGGLDRHLLRIALKDSLRIKHEAALSARRSKARDRDTTRVLNALDPALEPLWFDFLTRRNAPNTLALLEYAATIGTNRAPAPFQMVARAVILARFATGVTRLLLRDAGATLADMNYWQMQSGEQLGFWNAGSPPTSFSDLWIDIANDLASGMLDPSAPPAESTHDWLIRCGLVANKAAAMRPCSDRRSPSHLERTKWQNRKMFHLQEKGSIFSSRCASLRRTRTAHRHVTSLTKSSASSSPRE